MFADVILRGIVRTLLCALPLLTVAGPAAAEATLAASQQALREWPSEGRIEYEVRYGEMGISLGRAVHEWWHDEQHYRMQSVAKASGLLAAFDSLSYTQRSEGRLVRWGLQPTNFEVERGGRRREWSEFEWDKGEVALYRDGKARHAGIVAGDQDVLTLWHQIALAGPWSGERRLTVVTGKSAAPSRIEFLPDESIEVPAGRFEARHLRAAALDGSLTLEVWLAKQRDEVPLRILMVDRKGERLDQRALRIRLGPATAAQAREAGR